jgi:hypothetical protein
MNMVKENLMEVKGMDEKGDLCYGLTEKGKQMA